MARDVAIPSGTPTRSCAASDVRAGEANGFGLFNVCGNCEANSAVLLYSPEKKIVYGTVHEKGKTTLLGDPPAPVAGALATLWKKE